ncbi:hypothetical protein BYT27DRAFT_7276416 [Phlegmacium glaucopus]|nr:hypothetical protein BYT27DRAFT_7276416 [Phlegmacium glaucopus]
MSTQPSDGVDGTIFYSPNCNRPVIIPPHTPYSSSPFTQPRLNASMFKQPIWWSEFWGWVSFIPLAPSFTSTPFALFSWMPWIEQVEMCLDDIYLWKKSEELVVEAARRIQLFFGIQGNAPPTPSTFRYDCPHKSHAVTKRMISVSCDWFIVWMGFLSYLISRVELCHRDARPPLPALLLPDWYNLLRNKNNYADSWLDGLSSSTVCSFDLRTPRAGIEERRPQIEWFYHHHVPLWFTWTCTEEQAIRSDRRLSYLEPPVEMVQQALMLLFSSPNLPLAGLIMKKYFKLGNDPITNETLDLLRLEHAPSSDLKLLVESRKREHQAAAEAAASFPAQGMLDTVQVEKKGKLFSHFDDFFSAREKRQAEMIRVESAQDRQRRESRERDCPIKNMTMYTWEKVWSSGGQEMYMWVRVNKREHEDVYSLYGRSERLYNAASNEWDFCKDFCFPTAAGDPQPDSDSDEDTEYNDDEPQQFISEHRMHSSPSPLMDHAMDVVEESPAAPYSRDVLETLKLNYGYSTPLVNIVGSADHTWEVLLLALGFVQNLHELSVSKSNERGIRVFLSQIAKNPVVSPHLFDLHPKNYNPLEHLFKFTDVQRPSKDLFFTVADFETAMLRCQAVLSLPQGRAALLQGGIVGRIAKEYLSVDGVLAGPSLEVTAHRVGYLGSSGTTGILYCDDELTENEIAAICGTYTLYTGYGVQEAVWSWFPLPASWNAARSGLRSIDWMERCETWFVKLLANICGGKIKPKSHVEWVSSLRGQKLSRALIDNSKSLAETFVNNVVPLH